MTVATGSTRLDSALLFAERGVPVFPLRPHSKVPATPNGFHDATCNRTRIEAYWARRPDANVGIVTGSMPLVVDVDPRHGGDESLHELERTYEPLPMTVRVTTGGGGEHHYLRAHVPIGCSAGKLAPGLDVKSIGGYVVGPGSVHESGRQYGFDVGFDEAEIAEAPPWLIDLLRADTSKPAPRPVTEWQSISKGVGAGGRNDAAARLYGYMLTRHDAMTAYHLLRGWNRLNTPPLDEAELRRTAESIARRQRQKGGRS